MNRLSSLSSNTDLENLNVFSCIALKSCVALCFIVSQLQGAYLQIYVWVFD